MRSGSMASPSVASRGRGGTVFPTFFERERVFVAALAPLLSCLLPRNLFLFLKIKMEERLYLPPFFFPFLFLLLSVLLIRRAKGVIIIIVDDGIKLALAKHGRNECDYFG